MMSESTYTASPSIQPTFTKPLHTKIPPHQTLLTLDHAPLIDLSAHFSSLGTHMEELAVVSDPRFYCMEDRMDKYQVGFTYQFEHLQQRFERIEDHMDQH